MNRSTLPIQILSPATAPLPPVPDHSTSSCLDFISSDETLDRYHEIISAAGWKLDTYLRNPVFQNAHQTGDIIHTLGRALLTEIRPGLSASNPCLFQRIEFAVDANPIARLAFKLYQGGFLRAVSVGFIPLRWEDGTPGSSFTRKYLEQELLEVSAVSIPANPNALALAYKSGALEKSDLLDVATLCASTLSSGSAALPRVPNYHALAPTARLIAALLKR